MFSKAFQYISIHNISRYVTYLEASASFPHFVTHSHMIMSIELHLTCLDHFRICTTSTLGKWSHLDGDEQLQFHHQSVNNNWIYFGHVHLAHVCELTNYTCSRLNTSCSVQPNSMWVSLLLFVAWSTCHTHFVFTLWYLHTNLCITTPRASSIIAKEFLIHCRTTSINPSMMPLTHAILNFIPWQYYNNKYARLSLKACFTFLPKFAYKGRFCYRRTSQCNPLYSKPVC